MDILIPDEWLRDFLKTEATPKKIAEYLSLCGPSVEKVQGEGKNAVYFIEVTTNRVDSACVYGIAREAAAILPRFGSSATLHSIKSYSAQKLTDKVDYLDAGVDPDLCLRFSAVLIRNTNIKESPDWMKARLALVGVRPINNIVDISNYIMHELGQPVHTFDYGKIEGSKMFLRKSKPGEKLTTLDGKVFELPGGDIVIEDGKGRLIDLAGIMGGENSAIDEATKNVLLFVQTYNPVNIRRTSMTLAQRTEAADLFEKGLDPELVEVGIRRGIDLFVELTNGTAESKILDIYPNPYEPKTITTDLNFLTQRLGIDISTKEVAEIISSLGFKATWERKSLEVSFPSFRVNDVSSPEDIVEEVARIYGYHKLPSMLMTGRIPDPLADSPFDFEAKIKNVLKGWGAVEVYTLSMVPEEAGGEGALRLKNPLGKESEYMRTSLMPSLVAAANANSGEKERFHLFEMANVYLPRRSSAKAGLPRRVPSGTLPEEKMMLAGIFANTEFRQAKGIVETLMNELNIKAEYVPEDSKNFLPSQVVTIKSKEQYLGQFGVLEKGDLIYYEFGLETLRKLYTPILPYKPIPKYPAQIEDLTLVLPARTKVGDIISSIKSESSLINNVELTDIYKDSYTFRIWYQHPERTLTDKEVESIRKKVLDELKQKFGIILKD